MSRTASTQPGQLTFDALLADAARTNEVRVSERKFAHLPGSMNEAVPFFRALIERHHAAMLNGDAATVSTLRREAHDLAVKLNNHEPGILADETAPGCVLDRVTRADKGKIPLWGQSGSFEIQHRDMRVRIEMDGLFGIGASHMAWMGFAAHAVEKCKPFLSETGYRSFLGVGGTLEPGFTPDRFAEAIIAAYVERDLKERLVRIAPLRPSSTKAVAGRMSPKAKKN